MAPFRCCCSRWYNLIFFHPANHKTLERRKRRQNLNFWMFKMTVLWQRLISFTRARYYTAACRLPIAGFLLWWRRKTVLRFYIRYIGNACFAWNRLGIYIMCSMLHHYLSDYLFFSCHANPGQEWIIMGSFDVPLVALHHSQRTCWPYNLDLDLVCYLRLRRQRFCDLEQWCNFDGTHTDSKKSVTF